MSHVLISRLQFSMLLKFDDIWWRNSPISIYGQEQLNIK